MSELERGFFLIFSTLKMEIDTPTARNARNKQTEERRAAAEEKTTVKQVIKASLQSAIGDAGMNFPLIV
jgi:uncharacterized protein YhaN